MDVELLAMINELKKEIEILKIKIQKLTPRSSFLSLPMKKYTDADYQEAEIESKVTTLENPDGVGDVTPTYRL